MSQLPLTFYRCEHLGRSWFSGNPYRPTPHPPIECVVSVSLEGLSQVDSCACGTLGDAVGGRATAEAFLDASELFGQTVIRT